MTRCLLTFVEPMIYPAGLSIARQVPGLVFTCFEFGNVTLQRYFLLQSQFVFVLFFFATEAHRTVANMT